MLLEPNKARKSYLTGQIVTCDGMKEERRKLLAALLAERYRADRGRLIADSGLTHGRISQMLADGFGERSARELEASLKLPPLYFEQAPTAGLSPRARKIGELLDRLAGNESRHAIAYGELRDLLDSHLSIAPAQSPPELLQAPTLSPARDKEKRGA